MTGPSDRLDYGGQGERDGKDASQVSGWCNWMGWCRHLLRRDTLGGQPGLRFEFGGPLRQLEEELGKDLAIWGAHWGSCHHCVMRK